MKDKLGCRSHMFEGSFFSARCAYKKLSELCAGTPNRHILNQAPRQTRMVSWLSVYGAHYAPSVKCVEVHLLEVFTWHLANLSLYSTPSEPWYLPVCALENLQREPQAKVPQPRAREKVQTCIIPKKASGTA